MVPGVAMLQYINALEKVTSIFSVDRLTAQRRRRIARALVELHKNLDVVLANARLILKHKPDDLGIVEVDVSLLEKQLGALAETQRLLSTAPLQSVLRIKWKPSPRLSVISEGKGYVLALALAAFYGLLPDEAAEAEVNNYAIRRLRQEHSLDPDWAGPYDASSGHISMAEGFDEVKDGEQIVVFATPEHYHQAVRRVAELKRLTEKLRQFIAREFQVEELP